MNDDRFANPILHFGLIGSMYATGLLTLFYHTIGHNIPLASSFFSQSCKTVGQTKEVHITPDGLKPNNVTVGRCDVIVFINIDAVQHVIAFGSLKKHVNYPDFANEVLQPGSNQRITLRKSGKFELHDYLSDEVAGSLLVK